MAILGACIAYTIAREDEDTRLTVLSTISDEIVFDPAGEIVLALGPL